MILQKIRAQTAECHTEIEAKLDLFNRINTKTDYVTLLQRWLTYLEPIENKIAGADGWKHFEMAHPMSGRLKSAHLREDLAFCGAGEKKAHDGKRPNLECFENMVGFCYVIEGSTLGGQFISKEMKKRFFANEDGGTKFYSGYGANNGIMWKEFCANLENWGQRKDIDQDKVVFTAVETFKTLQEWLCGN